MMASICPTIQRMRSIPPGKTWSAAGHSVSPWRSNSPRAAKRFPVLEQRQRLQQMIGRRRAIALGNPLEKNQCPFGSLIQKRRGGSEREDGRIARTSANRQLGQLQEPGVALRIVESPRQPLNPNICIARSFGAEESEVAARRA